MDAVCVLQAAPFELRNRQIPILNSPIGGRLVTIKFCGCRVVTPPLSPCNAFKWNCRFQGDTVSRSFTPSQKNCLRHQNFPSNQGSFTGCILRIHSGTFRLGRNSRNCCKFLLQGKASAEKNEPQPSEPEKRGEELELPLKLSQSVTVVSFGEPYEGPFASNYCGERYPFTLGYCAVKRYKGTFYTQSIEEGPKGPRFVATCEEPSAQEAVPNSPVKWQGDTPEELWEQIAVQHGYHKVHCVANATAFFGLEHPRILAAMRAISPLPLSGGSTDPVSSQGQNCTPEETALPPSEPLTAEQTPNPPDAASLKDQLPAHPRAGQDETDEEETGDATMHNLEPASEAPQVHQLDRLDPDEQDKVEIPNTNSKTKRDAKRVTKSQAKKSKVKAPQRKLSQSSNLSTDSLPPLEEQAPDLPAAVNGAAIRLHPSKISMDLVREAATPIPNPNLMARSNLQPQTQSPQVRVKGEGSNSAPADDVVLPKGLLRLRSPTPNGEPRQPWQGFTDILKAPKYAPVHTPLGKSSVWMSEDDPSGDEDGRPPALRVAGVTNGNQDGGEWGEELLSPGATAGRNGTRPAGPKRGYVFQKASAASAASAAAAKLRLRRPVPTMPRHEDRVVEDEKEVEVDHEVEVVENEVPEFQTVAGTAKGRVAGQRKALSLEELDQFTLVTVKGEGNKKLEATLLASISAPHAMMYVTLDEENMFRLLPAHDIDAPESVERSQRQAAFVAAVCRASPSGEMEELELPRGANAWFPMEGGKGYKAAGREDTVHIALALRSAAASRTRVP